MYTGANFLNSVKWFFIPQNFLMFACKLACRSSIISGCEVFLMQGKETTSSQSKEIAGNLELLERIVIVRFADIILNDSISYQATALTTSNFTELGKVVGSISREDLNRECYSSTLLASSFECTC